TPTPPPTAPRSSSPAPAEAPPSLAETLETLVREVRALRQGQDRVLALLETRAGSARSGDGEEDEQAPALSPIRAGSRKSVVLIDDDTATREAAVTELEQADVPVRAFPDGNSAISGIAEQKPDVIILELGLDGQMAGKDVINMIKATMEWVDIPIVLWTRMAVASQKEARLIHGADEIVPKAAGAGALVGRVINIFRRG
ncbi:MAG TPA: response regulator, partial [Vicinamibacteria bacterium]|nr:response regulator [Vicinamibacteria bacterium]